jgi:cysteine desulfurase
MIYLDNAATTIPFPEVIEKMHACQMELYGNPSSTHSVGRKSKVAIESARKTIAKLIGASSAEIIFTSGGTEADNIFLNGIAHDMPHVISSRIEHPAVLNTLKALAKDKKIEISWLKTNSKGNIIIDDLISLLDSYPGSMVVLMHGNNEIGNLTDLDDIAALCKSYDAKLFTDAVQTMGHYNINVHALDLTGLSASAHKFHGPKGVGFLYVKKGTKLNSLYRGGEQEKGLRVGTENVAGIVGMATALEQCMIGLDEATKKMVKLKKSLIEVLKEVVTGISFNGTSSSTGTSLNSVISASFPPNPDNDMLLFNLDMAGIAASAGSACASGAQKPSHVMEAINHDPNRAVIRFSLSRMNTEQDIMALKKALTEIYSPA